jgi:hypothetical protein
MSEHPGLIGRIARELVEEGVEAGRIRLFSARPERAPALPVKVTRYRSAAANMAYGTLLGALAGAVIGLPLLLSGRLGLAPVLMIVVATGAGGALSRLWFGHGLGGELSHLDGALRQGLMVMVLDVEKARLAELEHMVSTRYPRVAVLGTGADGTPPFP